MNRIDEALTEHEEAIARAAQLSEELKELNARITYLEDQAIPNLIADTGSDVYQSSETGTRVEIKQIPVASCPAASAKDPESVKRRQEIFAWLESTNRDSIIKRKFEIALARGDKSAASIRDMLEGSGAPYSESHQIAPPTMKKFAKECAEEGIVLPACFKPDILNKAVIKHSD